eukprot:4012762-Amphidinium_carterae.1
MFELVLTNSCRTSMCSNGSAPHSSAQNAEIFFVRFRALPQQVLLEFLKCGAILAHLCQPS